MHLRLVKNELDLYADRLHEVANTDQFFTAGGGRASTAISWAKKQASELRLSPGQYYVIVTYNDFSGRVIPILVEDPPPPVPTVHVGLL